MGMVGKQPFLVVLPLQHGLAKVYDEVSALNNLRRVMEVAIRT